jgi:hypothetical protein
MADRMIRFRPQTSVSGGTGIVIRIYFHQKMEVTHDQFPGILIETLLRTSRAIRR